MFLFLLCWLGLASAEELPSVDESIIVEAHRDIELYVAPIQIRNEAPEIEAVIGDYSVFGFASMHSRHALVSNGTGGYVGVRNDFPRGFMVYNEDTIKYAWEDCNYRKDAKKCSYDNDHYLLETYVTVDRHQLVVEMFLYDSNLQIISRGEQTSNLKVTWIKQQEVKNDVTTWSNPQNSSGNCGDNNSCPPGTVQNQPVQTVVTTKPKEEMPLRWDVPHKLLNYHIKQASLKLWLGAKIDLKQ